MKAKDILKQEKELAFKNFTNEDAYLIASILIEQIKERALQNIRIRIVYRNEMIYQYLMDGKHGEIWLDRKQKTIETFQHSGYYLFLENEEKKTYEQYLNDESLVICGGSFPLIVDNDYAGCFLVSGLAHDQDHQLIVEALRKYQHRKALASDIDGTLYFHELAEPYKVNDIIAIKEFQKAGHLFGVCSGRPLCHFNDMRKLNLDFYIATSGAVLLDKHFHIIEDYPMEKEIARDLFERYHNNYGIIVQTNSLERFYATRQDFPNQYTYLFQCFTEVREDKIYGMSLVGENEEEMFQLKQELTILYPQLHCFQNKNSIDIVVKECSKGIAIRRMKQLLKVNEMAGIGDSYNDIPLLKESDYGFSFYHSPHDVKNEAKYLVSDIDEAIHIMMEE